MTIGSKVTVVFNQTEENSICHTIGILHTIANDKVVRETALRLECEDFAEFLTELMCSTESGKEALRDRGMLD